jgi:S-adenosyl-L-methionine hydrolase (adenosine-forming)
MQANGIITLTTDFGLTDPYAGIMRGVALSVNPDATLVDITHGIPAHDILNGSFTLGNAYAVFPEGTVHCAVVDPGVGGKRKNIAIQTAKFFFVGPDNGIFTVVKSMEDVREIREITNPHFIRTQISRTFHGRDVFAPSAGMLSKGENFRDIGPILKNMEIIHIPQPVEEGNLLDGELLSFDSFGNMITNITEERFRSFVGNHPFHIYFATVRFTELSETYEEQPPGTPLVIIGSGGYLEISMSSGNAEKYFMTPIGNSVSVRRL